MEPNSRCACPLGVLRNFGSPHFTPGRSFQRLSLISALEKKRMQIAGSTCVMCKQAIVLAKEGKFLSSRGTCAHIDCERGANCNVCGPRSRNSNLRFGMCFRKPLFRLRCGPGAVHPLLFWVAS